MSIATLCQLHLGIASATKTASGRRFRRRRPATATLFVSEYRAKEQPDQVAGYITAGQSIIWRMTAVLVLIAALLWFALEGQISRETLIAGAFAIAIAPALAFGDAVIWKPAKIC